MSQTSETTFSNIYRVLRLLGTVSLVTTALSLLRNKSFALLLGPSGFGSITLLQSLMGTAANLGGLGIGFSSITMISRARARNRQESVNSFERSLAVLGHCLALLTFVVTSIALAGWGRFLGWTSPSPYLAAVVGIGAGLSITASVATTRLQSRRSIRGLAASSLASAVLYTVIAIPVAWRLGANSVAIIVTALPLSQWVMAIIALRGFRSSERVIRPGVFKRTLAINAITVRRGFPLMLPGVADSLGASVVRVLGSASLGLAALGQVYAAMALAAFILAIAMSAMNQDFLPRLCEVANDYAKLRKAASEQLLVTIQLAAPVLLLVSTFSGQITHLLYSSRFQDTAVLLPVSALLVALQIVQWPVQTMQTALGLPLQQLAGSIASSVVAITIISWTFSAMSPVTFSLALLAGGLIQLLVQSLLLVRSTGIHYRWRDVAPILLLCALIVGLAIGRSHWPNLVLPAGSVAVIASAIIAARHFFRHQRQTSAP